MGAVLRVDEFSRCLARGWVTTLVQQVRPDGLEGTGHQTAEGPVMGASIHEQGIHREEIILSDHVFPISLPSKPLIKF